MDAQQKHQAGYQTQAAHGMGRCFQEQDVIVVG